MKTISQDLLAHLKIESNNKIIFSALFGIGKTYFLKEFFSLDGAGKDYESFFLPTGIVAQQTGIPIDSESVLKLCTGL